MQCTKSISAGSPPQAPLGELTALPRIQLDFRGHTSKGRGGGKKGEGKERKERRVIVLRLPIPLQLAAAGDATGSYAA